jgi:hypothetical protein
MKNKTIISLAAHGLSSSIRRYKHDYGYELECEGSFRKRPILEKIALAENMDWIGLDWIGLDWIGLDWIGLVDVKPLSFKPRSLVEE